jgi:ferredoxin
MKRQIIKIDEDKCNGCGLCIPDCPEGAIQLIEGKARLIGDLFCDGLGACLSTCPEGAIEIEEREAEPYDERRVMENVVKQGAMVIKAHLEHLDGHGESAYLATAVDYLNEQGIPVPDYKKSAAQHAQHQGCPGSQTMSFGTLKPAASGSGVKLSADSELRQWPVQLKLINPSAPYFENADLLIAADCAPVAHGDFHGRFLKDKKVILLCPKLDPYTDEYVDKLAMIFSQHNIKSITTVRMEVPCCGGINSILMEALRRAGKNIFVKENVVSIQGQVV